MRLHRVAISCALFCAAVWCSRHVGVWCVTGAAVLTLLLARIRFRHPAVRELGSPLIYATLAGVLVAALRPDVPAISEQRTATYDAVVVGCDELQADGLRVLLLRLDGMHVEAVVRSQDVPIGLRLRIRGRLEPPDVARNPGEPSPRDLARERGIDGSLERATILAMTSDVDASDASLWLPRARAWATARVRDALDEPYSSIATGALFGDRGTLPRDLRSEFQETGTTHVLVTAGLHLGVVAAMSVALLRAAGCGRVSSSLAAIVIVWLYAFLSGGHVPSERAAAMATVALVARASGRKALSWNALGMAAATVVLLRPSSIDSVSFAMSFACVSSIALFAAPIEAALAPLRLPHVVRDAIALTVATQLGTWPLTAATFLTIAPYAPLANVLVVPVVGLVMVLGLGLVACADIAPLAHLLANAETTLLAWIVAVVGRVASLPGAHVAASPPPVWTIVLYLATLPLAAALLRRGRSVAGVVSILLASVCCVAPPALPSHELQIVVLDVGQADAIVIRTPDGHVFLVDAGGRLERGGATGADDRAEAVGERIVVPYLLRQGIHRIDALLITHPHGDHVAGAPPVIRDLDVAALADSGQSYPGRGYHETMRLARERSIPVLEPRGGDVWRTDDGVVFRFYAPTVPFITGSRSDINSNSIVFRLEYGTFRMLFTGDAGAETEARLLASHVDLRSTVLKVGHHGSAYGTTDAFVTAVDPRTAIISVGRHNLFGHPAPQTITELRQHGIATFRTDHDGAVTVTTSGTSYGAMPYIER